MNKQRTLRKLENHLKFQGKKFSIAGSLLKPPANINKGLCYGLPKYQASEVLKLFNDNISVGKRTWLVDIIYTSVGNKASKMQLVVDGNCKELINIVERNCHYFLVDNGQDADGECIGYYWEARLKEYVGKHQLDFKHLRTQAEIHGIFDSAACVLAHREKCEAIERELSGEEHFI